MPCRSRRTGPTRRKAGEWPADSRRSAARSSGRSPPRLPRHVTLLNLSRVFPSWWTCVLLFGGLLRNPRRANHVHVLKEQNAHLPEEPSFCVNTPWAQLSVENRVTKPRLRGNNTPRTKGLPSEGESWLSP